MHRLVRSSAVLAWALACSPALAAGPSTASRNVTVTLVSAVQSVEPGQTLRVGLHLKMAPDWHTYWQQPGDSGLPTRMTWKLPEGFSAGPLLWPYPERIPAPPLMSYGYSGEALLMTDIAVPATAAGQAVIGGKVSWLECKEACIPGKGEIEITLPVRAGAAAPSDSAALFATASARLPVQATGWTVDARRDGNDIELRVVAGSGSVRSAYFFSDEGEVVDFAAPQELKDGSMLRLRGATNPRTVEKLSGVLVVEGVGAGPQAIVVSTPLGPPLAQKAANALAAVAPQPANPPPAVDRLESLPLALGLAFVGGLILNLMPCVLPVLSLKVLGFVRHGAERGAWRHGLAFTAGVLLSFWLLAGLLLLLRASGQQIGWGFQLQSPAFVASLAALFFLLGLNLFGVFEVGEELTAAGGLAAGREGLAASAWSGALATVVATPCTAPFMGSALGYGLSQPAHVSFLVFTFLALGMAAPYMLLSVSPRLLRYVPRPGAWMMRFKQLMGFLMMATVVALAWLFGQHTGTDGMAQLLAGLVVVGMGGWVFGQWGTFDRSPRQRAVATLAALLLIVAGVAGGMWRSEELQARRVAAVTTTDSNGHAWEPWSAERVAELRRSGTPVFVDFTAAWCLTCQVNEKVALGAPQVVDRFRRSGVVMLRADWTARDDAITRALAEHGRQGVPLYVLYGPGQPPLLLPELLTEALVLNALDRAFPREDRT